MRKVKHIILILCFILLCCGIVEAVPPITTIFAGDTGLHLEVNAMAYYKLGEARWQIIQIFNESNGYQFTNDTSNITCIVKLRNSQGFEIIEINATANDDQWDINGSLGANNPLGEYAWTIVCQDGTTKDGGYVSGYFEITEDGKTTDTQDSSVLTTIMFIIVLFIILMTILMVISNQAWLKLLLILPVSFLLMILTRFMSWFVSIDYPGELGLINVLDKFYLFAVTFFYILLAIIPILMIIVIVRDRKKIQQDGQL